MKHIIFLSLFASIAIQAFSQAANPVAVFKFDEGTGTAVKDTAGVFKGEIKNAQWADGKSGKALAFSGSNSYAAIKFTNLDGGFTFIAWTKPNAIPADLPFGETSIVARPGFHSSIAYTTAKKFFFNYWTTNNRNVVAMSSDESPSDAWYHVAGVYDKTAGKTFIYVNGELKGTAVSPEGTEIRKYDAVLYIGCGTTGGKYAGWYTGAVDDVKVFSRALTADEVRSEFAAQ
ncbi:MAG: LamG domain-containing protein [Spirochaetes bacterium]|nr:LamG domain-containing protein [Spirochaetota bacterium]